MALAGTLEIQMLANIARLQADMNQAKTVVGGAMKNIESAVASAKTALGALGIGLGVGYFTSLIKGTIDAADHLNDLTQSLGINMQELAKYKLATAQSGSSLEGLGKGIKGLTNAFAEHGDELRAAGITAKTADGQIRQLADIFSKMPDGLEKTTLATKLFGKSGMELIPMLNMGAAGLDEAANKSAKYAAVMGELGPRADKFNDSMTELAMASKVASMSIINDALPAMTVIAAAMAAAAQESGSLKAAWVGFGGIAWEGVFKPLIALMKGTMATLTELNAKMLQFFGANAAATDEFRRAGQVWKEIAAMESAPPTPKEQKQFDTAAWTEQYKKLVAALGLGKKATEDSDSAYRRLLKTLNEMLLTERERTQVNKLQIELDALSAKERAKITPEKEKELKAKAALVDLMKREKDATKVYITGQEELKAILLEAGKASADLEKIRSDAITAADKQNKQMEFETTLLGMTNVQRETAIFLRQSEIDKIDAATIARGREAIAAKHVAEEAKSTQVSMWQSIESAGHQAFLSIFDTSKSVLTRIRDMLKTHLLDILYQVTIKRWLVQIAVGTSGAGVAQSAFGSSAAGSAGGGMLGNMVGSAVGRSGFSSLFGSGVGGLGGSAAGVMTAAPVYEAGTLVSAGTYASGMAGAEAVLAAIPGWGWAALAAAAIGAYLLNGGDDRTATPQLAGLGSAGTIGRGGFSGQQWVASGSSPTDLWAGSVWGDLAADQLAGFNKQIAQVFSDAEKAAKQLGLDTSSLASITSTMGATGQGVQADMAAALQKTADTIALSLMPNIRDLQQGSETLAQTFGRLAAEQAALDAQRRGLEIQLMEAQGNAAGALAAKREDELKALDASLRPLQEQIYAAQDLAAASGGAAEAMRTLADIADERRGLQDDLDALTMSSVELLAKQRNALDESNRALFDQITAAQAAQKAAQDLAAAQVLQDQAAQAAAAAEAQLAQIRQSWQNKLDLLTGATTQRQIDLAAQTDAATQALMREVFAQEDLAAAAQAAVAAAQTMAAIASQRYGLETQLLKEQGDTLMLRVRELALLDESNRPLQEQIWAIQDKAAADALAAQAAQAAAQASAQAASAAQQAADQQQRAAEQLKSAWQSATDSILDEVRRIRGLSGMSPQSLAAAQAQFAISTAQARAGDLDAANLLPELSRSILDMALATATSALEMQRLRGQIAGSLAATAGQSAARFGLALPAYASGTDYVPWTGPAMLHQGERVMTSAANDDLVAEMRAMRAELAALRGSSADTATNTGKSEKYLRNVTRGGEGMIIAADSEIPVTVVMN